MSQQTSPLTYEGILELFRKSDERFDRRMEESAREFAKRQEEAAERQAETDRKFREMTAETDRQIKETAERQAENARQLKETRKRIEALGSRIGEIIENMVGGDIVKQFQALNIDIHSHSRDKTFGKRRTDESGQIDVFLENGDFVILIEVKTRLTDDDVREHIERMQKYRLYGNDKRRIVGAVAGGVVSDDVAKFAHRKGMYVIVQSGEAVEIIAQPEGFKAKEW